MKKDAIVGLGRGIGVVGDFKNVILNEFGLVAATVFGVLSEV